MNITLKHLEAFLAVAKTLSFSQAADALHLSQPALSANIRTLEEVIGARLFDRDTRSVSLSVVGNELLPVAKAALEQIDHGMARIRDLVAGKRGRLSIAVAPSVAAALLPNILVQYKQRYPDIELKIHDELSNGCLSLLRSGGADVALMPERPDADDLIQLRLFQDPLVVVCATKHPLALRRNLDWTDVIPCKLIVRSHDSSVRQLLESQYRAHGVLLEPAFEVDNVGTVLGLVVAGLGIAVLPSSILQTINMKGMVFRPFQETIRPYWTICASTPRVRTSAPAVEPFVKLCQEMLQADVLRSDKKV